MHCFYDLSDTCRSFSFFSQLWESLGMYFAFLGQFLDFCIFEGGTFKLICWLYRCPEKPLAFTVKSYLSWVAWYHIFYFVCDLFMNQVSCCLIFRASPHLNINLEMNYWPTLPCNLSECQEPLFDLIGSLAVNGTKTAKVSYGLYSFLVWFQWKVRLLQI